MEWYTAGTDDGSKKLVVSFEDETEQAQFMGAVRTAIASSAKADYEMQRINGSLPAVSDEDSWFSDEPDTVEANLFKDIHENFTVNLQYYISMLYEQTRQLSKVISEEQRKASLEEIRQYTKSIHEEFTLLSESYDDFQKSCKALLETQSAIQKDTERKLTEAKNVIQQYETIITSHASNAYLPKEYRETDKTIAEYHNLEWRQKINHIKLLQEKRRVWLRENEQILTEKPVCLRKIPAIPKEEDVVWFLRDDADNT